MLIINQFDKKNNVYGNPNYLFHAIKLNGRDAENVTKDICKIMGCRYSKKGHGSLETYGYFPSEVKDRLMRDGYDVSEVVFVGY